MSKARVSLGERRLAAASALAVRLEISVSDLVRRALDQFLAGHGIYGHVYSVAPAGPPEDHDGATLEPPSRPLLSPPRFPPDPQTLPLCISPTLPAGGDADSKPKPYPADFEEFWAEYPTGSPQNPRRVGKRAAFKAWQTTAKERPALPVLLASLRRQKASEAWTKDGGKYVPHPRTWLSQGRWDDGGPVSPPFPVFPSQIQGNGVLERRNAEKRLWARHHAGEITADQLEDFLNLVSKGVPLP